MKDDKASAVSIAARAVAGAAGLAAAAAGTAWIVRATWGLPISIGAGTANLRKAGGSSPQFDGRHYVNGEASTVLSVSQFVPLLREFATRGPIGRPSAAVPLDADSTRAAAAHPAAELAATWFGHASALIEVDGQRILVDPVWGERVSPSRLVGPRRLHAPPVQLTDVPQVDAILISHDHYDHLDLPTVRVLMRSQSAPFVVPLGIGAHLRRWKVPESRIIELDWNENYRVGELTLVCTEARHFSGRLFERDTTLWASWAIIGPRHRVYFGGDTGYTAGFTRIGQRYGPFNLSLLPIGAYGDQWPDIHLNPEEAVRAHADLTGGLFLPIHWASFDLALHAWGEPIARLQKAAEDAGITLTVPRPGERVVPGQHQPTEDWWSALSQPSST